MKGFQVYLICLMVACAFSAPPWTIGQKRQRAGTGWRGKLSKFLPGPLGRRLAFNTATGYETNKCVAASELCPAAANSACTGLGAASPGALCTGQIPDAEPALKTARQQLYAWAAQEATSRAADTVFEIAAGANWNQWGSASGCGPSGCANIYKKAILVYDEANCWPKSKAVPILVNARDGAHNEQLQLCASTVKHMLGKKPLGAFLRSPVEQLEHIVLHNVLFTCGNTLMTSGVKDTTKAQYPYLEAEGGGATATGLSCYAEHNGMCGSWNTALTSAFQIGGTRFGGTVTTEEYGHTFFDVAIAQYDPQGWLAVQKAEAKAAAAWVANNAVGHERDADWDCHTAATEFFAAGVELLLYNVRIGENLKATTRSQLKTQDPELWCLALRHYELNNKFATCASGPTIADVTQDVDCKAVLGVLGVTIFGPDGSNGVKGGGSKINSMLAVSSDATCPSDSLGCAAYSASVSGATGGTTGGTTGATTGGTTGGTTGQSTGATTGATTAGTAMGGTATGSRSNTNKATYNHASVVLIGLLMTRVLLG